MKRDDANLCVYGQVKLGGKGGLKEENKPGKWTVK